MSSCSLSVDERESDLRRFGDSEALRGLAVRRKGSLA
jgi:hypothetical protein